MNRARTSLTVALAKRFTSILLLLLAMGGVLLATPSAGADPNNANCKPNRATCTANHRCCSGFCSAGRCAALPTTTSTTSTSATSSTTTSTTTITTSSTTTTTLRFVDNGDGTVTDHQTGLIWEKKTGTVGTPVLCATSTDCPDPHDVNGGYMWSSSASAIAPDGGAFTLFLNTLNGGVTGVGNCTSSDGTTLTGGFAGHCDWRLPSIVELAGIVDLSAPGCSTFTGPCIDQTVFGPTVAAAYWSATADALTPDGAWFVSFRTGIDVQTDLKLFGFFVRAVRGGS